MKKSLILFLALIFFCCICCAITQRVELLPEASKIEIVTGEPDRNICKYLGEVQGEAKATDIGKATTNARNDIKNKAYALGANIVKIDTTGAANAMDWTGRNKLVLSGRAFSCKNR